VSGIVTAPIISI